MFAYHIYRR